MIFRAERGHLWHTVHATATGSNTLYTCTLCSVKVGAAAFGPGKRKTGGVPTCLDCRKLDDVFGLSDAAGDALEEVVTGVRGVAGNRGYRELQERDLVDGQYALTARGDLLARDFREFPVPMPDASGVYHDRLPLSRHHACRGSGYDYILPLPAFEKETPVSLYAKLCGANAGHPTTCVACIVGSRH